MANLTFVEKVIEPIFDASGENIIGIQRWFPKMFLNDVYVGEVDGIGWTGIWRT